MSTSARHTLRWSRCVVLPVLRLVAPLMNRVYLAHVRCCGVAPVALRAAAYCTWLCAVYTPPAGE